MSLRPRLPKRDTISMDTDTDTVMVIVKVTDINKFLVAAMDTGIDKATIVDITAMVGQNNRRASRAVTRTKTIRDT